MPPWPHRSQLQTQVWSVPAPPLLARVFPPPPLALHLISGRNDRRRLSPAKESVAGPTSAFVPSAVLVQKQPALAQLGSGKGVTSSGCGCASGSCGALAAACPLPSTAPVISAFTISASVMAWL